MNQKQENAIHMFSNGFNCAQSVLGATYEDYGLTREQALKITCGFGGGCRSGEICGAASAGVMLIGLKYGHCSEDDIESKNKCYTKTIEFMNKFREKNKSVVCRELLGCDTSTPEGQAIFKENNLSKTICTPLIVDTIEILDSI